MPGPLELSSYYTNSYNNHHKTSFVRGSPREHKSWTSSRSQTPVEDLPIQPLFGLDEDHHHTHHHSLVAHRDLSRSPSMPLAPSPPPPVRSPMDISSIVSPYNANEPQRASPPPRILAPTLSVVPASTTTTTSLVSRPPSPTIVTLSSPPPYSHLPLPSTTANAYVSSATTTPTSAPPFPLSPRKHLRETSMTSSVSPSTNSPGTPSPRLGLELLAGTATAAAATARTSAPGAAPSVISSAASDDDAEGGSGGSGGSGPPTKRWKSATGFRTGMTAEKLTPLEAPTRPRKPRAPRSRGTAGAGSAAAGTGAGGRSPSGSGSGSAPVRQGQGAGRSSSSMVMARRNSEADELASASDRGAREDSTAMMLDEAETDLLREFEGEGGSGTKSEDLYGYGDEFGEAVDSKDSLLGTGMTEEERKADEKRRRNTKAARLSRQRKQDSVNALQANVASLSALCSAQQAALDSADYQARLKSWELLNAERRLNLLQARLIELMGSEKSRGFMEYVRTTVETMADAEPVKDQGVKVGPLPKGSAQTPIK